MIRNFKKLVPLLTQINPAQQQTYRFLAVTTRRPYSIFGGKKTEDEPLQGPKNLDPKDTGRHTTLNEEHSKSWTEAAKDTVKSAAEKVKSFVSDQEPLQKSFSEVATEKIRASTQHAKEKAKDATENLKEKAEETYETAKEKVKDTAESAQEKAREYTEIAKERGRDVAEKARDYSEAAKEKGKEYVDAAKEKGREYVDAAKEKGKEAVDTAREYVGREKGGNAWEHAQRGAGLDTPGMEPQDLKRRAEDIADTMKENKEKIKESVNAAKEGEKGMAEKVKDKVMEMGEKVIDKAKSMAHDAKEKVEHVVKGDNPPEEEKFDAKKEGYSYGEKAFGKREAEDYDEIFPERAKDEDREGIGFFSSSTYMVSINSSAEWENLKNKEKPIVVDFYQLDCAECKRIYPKLIENAKRDEGKWVLAGADMDKEKVKTIAKKLKVKHAPTVMLYYRGDIVDHVVGHDESHLDRLFEKARELNK